MEGIPAPDVANYKRKKEIELGLAPGTFGSTPGAPQQQKRNAGYENRIYTAQELKHMLDTHIALMGRRDEVMGDATVNGGMGAVMTGAAQTYALPPPMPGMPPMPPPGVGLPFPPPGMPFPPPGMQLPPGMGPPFPPGGMPFPP